MLVTCRCSRYFCIYFLGGDIKMRKIISFSAMLAISAFLTACDPTANTGNKAANAPANNTAAATPSANPAAVEAEIKKLVTDTAAALAKNDADALDKMYGENYMLVNLDGSVQNKAERLASIRSGDTKFESFVYDEVNVRTNPEGTGAVVIGRALATGKNKGVAIPANRYIRVTQVWSKTKDGWRQVSGQATNIEGAGAAGTPANTSNTAANTSANKPANTAANK
jgi:ketosteroid isomerase-like protein